jgi:stage II sporulation protein D
VEKWKSEPVIKVLVVENAASVTIQANGNHTVSTASGSTPVLGMGSWNVTSAAGGLSVILNGTQHLTNPSLPIKVAPDERTLLKVNGKPYRGWLAVTPGTSSGFNVINLLPMEAYLYGVVPREIPCSKDILNAVEAQAICARSYAIARFGGHSKQGFDIYSDTRDQAYGGMAVENQWGTEGVNRTRGLVAFSEEKLLDARYSSTCGGHTANSEDVWSSAISYLRGIRDAPFFGKAYCASSPHFDWTKNVPKSQFYSVIGRSIPAGAKIKSWSLDINHNTHRVVKMLIKSDKGTHEIKGSVLRTAFGLKSTWFTISQKGENMVFTGHGWGHGVGMCQYGAMEMARRGKSPRKILRHYYKDAWVGRLYK